MNIEYTDQNTFIVKYLIKNNEIESYLQKTYLRYSKTINVHGFRKGKVPKNIIEKHVGKNYIYNESLRYFFEDNLLKIINQYNWNPLMNPEIELEGILENNDVEVNITIYNRPIFHLPNYKELDLKFPESIVTEEDIQKIISEELEKHSNWNQVNRKTKNRDKINFNFEGFLNEIPFENGKAENYETILGENNFIPGFEEKLLDRKINEDFEFFINFPDQYHASYLSGKETKFKVKINSIFEKTFPQLDDDFIKTISLYSKVEDYKQYLKEKELQKKEEENKTIFKNEIINKIVDNTDINIQEKVIENNVINKIEKITQFLKEKKISMKQYLDHYKLDMESLREKLKEEVKFNIKVFLIIEEIAKIENIKIEQQEYDQSLQDYVNKYNKNINQELINDIKQNILYEKVVSHIINYY